MNSKPLYPIREVSKLTGVNPVTLRAWQRRYGLIQPARTETGHRLYSDDDVSKIREILCLLEQGISIGQTRSLLETATPLCNGSNWEDQRHHLTESAQELKLNKLETTLSELSKLYPTDLLLRQVIEPWLKELAVSTRPDRELVERSARSVVLRFCYQKLTIQSGPTIAVGTTGNTNELNAALIQYELQGMECRSVYLGKIEPKQLAMANSRLNVDAWIVLLGSGLTENWFQNSEACWQENTYFIGEVGVFYHKIGWLNKPFSKTLGDLARENNAFSHFLQA